MAEPWLTFSNTPPTSAQKQITPEEVRQHIIETGVRTTAQDYAQISALFNRFGLAWNQVRHTYAPTHQTPRESDGIITVHGNVTSGDLKFSAMNIEADAVMFDI